MKYLAALIAFYMLASPAPGWSAPKGDHVRLLVLPFQPSAAPRDDAADGSALTAMIEACFSRVGKIALVDRDELDLILAEHARALHGLVAGEKDLATGRLAGAEVILGGSFVAEGEKLLLTGRAVDVESGSVLSSVTLEGRRGGWPDLAFRFCGTLASDLKKTDLQPFRGAFEEMPEEGLHFLRGLGSFHASRFELALGEFFRAAASPQWSVTSRYWIARTYEALGKPAHACLELQALPTEDLPPVVAEDAERLSASCRKRVSRDEAELLQLILKNEE